MPRLSTFYGIVIAMYYRDHAPPHFHARYAEYSASVVIESLEVLAGSLPDRALRMVRDWANEHREELSANWALAQDDAPLHEIDPLP